MSKLHFICEDTRGRLFGIFGRSFSSGGKPSQQRWEAFENRIRKKLKKTMLNDEPTAEKAGGRFLLDCLDSELITTVVLYVSKHLPLDNFPAAQLAVEMINSLFEKHRLPYRVSLNWRGKPVFRYDISWDESYERMLRLCLSDESLEKRAIIESDWLRSDCREIGSLVFRIKTIGETFREQFFRCGKLKDADEEQLGHVRSSYPPLFFECGAANEYMENLYGLGCEALRRLSRLDKVNDLRSFPTFGLVVDVIRLAKAYGDLGRKCVESSKREDWYWVLQPRGLFLEALTLTYADLCNDLCGLLDVLASHERKGDAVSLAQDEASAKQVTAGEASADGTEGGQVPKRDLQEQGHAFRLRISGCQEGGQCVVLINKQKRKISVAQLSQLLRLVLQRKKGTDEGWVRMSELAKNDEAVARNWIWRLRKRLGIKNKNLIENDGAGRYRIAMSPDKITYDKAGLLKTYKSTENKAIVSLIGKLPDPQKSARNKKSRRR